jgi:hypothetical protein
VDKTTYCAVFMPYCLELQDDGTYVVLNRNYKPLGFATKNWTDYSAYPVGVSFDKMTQAKIEKLSIHGEARNGKIYLYADASAPNKSKRNMEIYLEKLALLSPMSVSSIY